MKKSFLAVVFMAAGVTFASAQTTEKNIAANDAKKEKAAAAMEVKAATPQLEEVKADASVEKAAVKRETAAELKATEVKKAESKAKVKVD